MILEACGISFRYNSHPVLDKVKFTVQPGELLAILGPNGVGKTTLLKCMNKLLRPQGGTVFLGKDDLLSLSPSAIARNVGYVAQHSETAGLTVYDAVLMGRKPHIRWKAGEEDLKKVDSVLSHLALKPLALRSIDQLSGGELQKVSVARALVQEPRLLLLDEPTSSLDLKNQVSILTLIRRVIDEHLIAGIMTMHDLNTALRYADSFIFLKDGAVLAHARSTEITSEMIREVYGLPVEIHSCGKHSVVVPAD